MLTIGSTVIETEATVPLDALNVRRAAQGSGSNTPPAPGSRDAAVINAVRINAVPLDIASYGAILGSIEGAAGSTGNSARDGAVRQNVMAMIGDTLLQGQGGYYLAINAPGGSLMTAMTPGQLQAYMQSNEALYQDTLVSSDGNSYSLFGLLQQAFAANARAERSQIADPAMADPNLLEGEALLDQMKARRGGRGNARPVPPDGTASDRDAAKTIRTLVLQMSGTGNHDAVRLSIVYFPPGIGNLPFPGSGASGTAGPPQTIQLTD